MQYTNDEADKAQRKRDYIIRVFILPFIAGAVCFGLLYAGERSNLLQPVDVKVGNWMVLILMLAIFTFSNSKWLKMPDGSRYHISAIHSASNKYTAEPAIYEEEFHYSNSKKIASLFIGIVTTGFGIYLMLEKKMFLFSMFSVLLGIFFTYWALTNILNKIPQLKIAKQGLWTKKLGFLPWKEIARAKVKEEKTSDGNQLNLEIWLKDTAFAQAGKPDQVLNLTEIKNGKYVEAMIQNLFLSSDDMVRQ